MHILKNKHLAFLLFVNLFFHSPTHLPRAGFSRETNAYTHIESYISEIKSLCSFLLSFVQKKGKSSSCFPSSSFFFSLFLVTLTR